MWEIDEQPTMIKSEVNYGILKEVNEQPKHFKQHNHQFLNIKQSEISQEPGADWMYYRYSEYHLNILKLVHIGGILLEIGALLVGELVFDFRENTHNSAPYTMHHDLSLAAWCTIVGLESFFLLTIYKESVFSIELVADEFGYLIFLAYILLAAYLCVRNLTENLAMNICFTVMLGALSVVLFVIYRRVKYPDDGRYVVSRVAYLGVHVRFGLLVGWVLICFLHRIFMCISFSEEYNGDEKTFLNWENSSWSILAMVGLFVVGVIFLYTYKDIYFALIVAYTDFGIGLIRDHEDCDFEIYNNCESKVIISALVLGMILFFFILISLCFYFKPICYLKRSHEEEMSEFKPDYWLQKEAELRRLNEHLEAEFRQAQEMTYEPLQFSSEAPLEFEQPLKAEISSEEQNEEIEENEPKAPFKYDFEESNEQLQEELEEQKSIIKFQKARIEALQDELQEALSTINDQGQTIEHLENSHEARSEDSKRQSEQVQTLTANFEKLKKQFNESKSKLASQERTINDLNEEIGLLKNLEKKSSKEVNTRDVRMNRLIEEVERYKEEIKDLRNNDSESSERARKEIERLQEENRRLERQKNEVLAAFRKELKLIDILKREKFHVEGARLLGFTEEEFMKTLELGDKL